MGFGPTLLHVGNIEFANVHEMASDGCGGSHHRADEVRAAVAALAAFKVSIGGACAAFVRRQNVGVHADTHTAASIAPLEPGFGKNFVQAFFFRGSLYPTRSGNDQGLLDRFRDMFPGSRGIKRSEEHTSELQSHSFISY